MSTEDVLKNAKPGRWIKDGNGNTWIVTDNKLINFNTVTKLASSEIIVVNVITGEWTCLINLQRPLKFTNHNEVMW